MDFVEEKDLIYYSESQAQMIADDKLTGCNACMNECSYKLMRFPSSSFFQTHPSIVLNPIRLYPNY